MSYLFSLESCVDTFVRILALTLCTFVYDLSDEENDGWYYMTVKHDCIIFYKPYFILLLYLSHFIWVV